MNVPGTEVAGGRAGGLANVKFSLYIFSFFLFSFCLLKIPRKNIYTNNSISWFVIYLLISACSLVIYNFQIGRIDSISWARLIGLCFFVPYFWVLNYLQTNKILQIVYISKLIPIAIIGFLYFVSKASVMREIWVDGHLDAPRLGGMVIPPNTLGGMLAIVILLTPVILKNSKKISLLIIAPLGLMLYATQARTAMLALIASSIIGYVVAFRNITKRIKIIAACILGIVSFPTIYENISLSSTRLQTGLTTFGGRLTLWEQAYNKIDASSLLNSLFGFGFMLPNSWFHTGGLTTNSLHNGYFQVLFGTGLLGFSAYLLIWYTLVISKHPKDSLHTFAFYSLFSFLFVFNLSELGSFVLVNSMSLTFLALIGIALDASRSIDSTKFKSHQ